MPTLHWQTADDKVNGVPLNGIEWDTLARCCDAQVPGALQALGAGVIDGDPRFASGASLAVSLVGGDLEVAPGAAIVVHSLHGPVYVESESGGPTTVGSLVDDGANYIFVAAHLDDQAGTADSREGTAIDFVIDQSPTLDGGVLLARLTLAGGVPDGDGVVDLREWYPITQLFILINALLAADLAIHNAIGWPYTVSGGHPNIETRLTALEAPGPLPDGSGPSSAQFNALLAQVDALTQRVAALEAAGNPSGNSVVRVATANELLRVTLSQAIGALVRVKPEAAKSIRSAVVIPSLAGIGQLGPDGTAQRVHLVGGNLIQNDDDERLE